MLDSGGLRWRLRKPICLIWIFKTFHLTIFTVNCKCLDSIDFEQVSSTVWRLMGARKHTSLCSLFVFDCILKWTDWSCWNFARTIKYRLRFRLLIGLIKLRHLLSDRSYLVLQYFVVDPFSCNENGSFDFRLPNWWNVISTLLTNYRKQNVFLASRNWHYLSFLIPNW